MKLLGSLASALFRRSRMERDMAEELRFHIDSRSEDLMRTGLSRAEATRRARIEFGAVEAYKDRCRETVGVRWFDEVRGDIRYTLRSLRRSPGFALAAVLSLAVGIGVNVAAFASVHAIVLFPFPYPHLERLMTVWQTSVAARTQRGRVAVADFFDFQEQNASFERLSAYRPWDVMLTGVGDPERVQAAVVTVGFFETFGMRPVHGRSFSGRDGEPGFDGVAVVSHAFWKNRLGSPPEPVGQMISLGGRPYTVIGVMPDEFDYPLATEVWAPLALAPAARQERSAGELRVIGRLKADVSPTQARAELDALAKTLEQRYPQTNERRGVLITPLREIANEITDRFALILLGAATFVLLLACANVGNLYLARSTARQKEIATRAALGASRARLVRQLLTESAVIGIMAGALGLLLANWDLAASKAAVPPQVLQWTAGLRTMDIGWDVMMFCVAVSVLVGVGCALPSIYQLLRERQDGPNEALKEGGRATSSTLARGWVRNALVIAEVALALVLLVAAGVMVRTFQHMLALDAGFDPKNLLTMDVALSATQYREPARITQFYQAAVRRLDVMPGVDVAAASGGVGTAITVFTARRGDARPGEPRPYIRAVTPRYFQAMRIPIVQGRPIGDHDEPEAMPVVVLSESVVRHYWPDASPIGEQIRFGGPQSRLWTVVGVCGDVRDWFGGDPRPAAYVSHQQWSTSSMTLWLRTRQEPMQSARDARAAVRAIDASQPVFNVKSMEQELAEETSGVRIAARLMGGYAGISLLLALMGTYAVGAFFVVQRTQEFGVRVALGATRWNIVRLVLTDTASTSAIGLAVGLSLAMLLTQIMSRVLFNVVVIEPMTFVIFTSLLAASVFVAGYLPARRAARVDPVIALRNE